MEESIGKEREKIWKGKEGGNEWKMKTEKIKRNKSERKRK